LISGHRHSEGLNIVAHSSNGCIKPLTHTPTFMLRAAKSLLRTIATVTGKRPVPQRDPHLTISEEMKQQARSWGFFDETTIARPRVLIAAGHGYGNVGDEAQVGACIRRWRRAALNAQITMFTPSPAYTAALHGERTEWAPRVAWFRSNTSGPYYDHPDFESFFRGLKFRLELSARLFRASAPLMFCNPREARILQLIQEHDIIHISGGGYLTGKTRSRLWEFCLLMRMCQLLGKPYILTGHNIGVFQDANDRKIVKMGLAGANHIGLRDRGISEKELAEIGVTGPHITSTCDDALFCERISNEEVHRVIQTSGGDATKPWVAVNFHHWGQDESSRDSIESRFAEVCDQISAKYGLQIALIAMTPSDVAPEANIAKRMKQPSLVIPYSPDYRVVRGIIANSLFVFTMKHHPIVFAQGECVPVVSVALDDYYYHKNKGAMDNTGDGQYLADARAFSDETVLTIIDRAIRDQGEIRERMKRWTDTMREIELAPYHNALTKLGLTS
jgi:polysaccharide pyruvyl transferase WcaK-like protein